MRIRELRGTCRGPLPDTESYPSRCDACKAQGVTTDSWHEEEKKGRKVGEKGGCKESCFQLRFLCDPPGGG